MNTDAKTDATTIMDAVNVQYGLIGSHHQGAPVPIVQQQVSQPIYSYYNPQCQSGTPFASFAASTTQSVEPAVPTVTSTSTPPVGHIDEHLGNLDSCINELNTMSSLMQHCDNITSSSQSPQAPLTPQNQDANLQMTPQSAGNPSIAVKKTPKKQNTQNISLNESSSTAAQSGNKRRKKDPMAPKAPLNGYLVYFNEERVNMRQKHPNMSFGELTKIIAIQWKELKQEDKQKYTDEAEADKERYIKEMESYKKSDAYKHYVKETAAAKQQIQQQKLNHQQQQKIHQQHQQNDQAHNQFNAYNHGWPMMQSHYEMNGASSSMIASSIQQPRPMQYHHPHEATNGNIPIFTDDFMDHNKAREQELRHLRKEINEYEHQNSLLNKHLDTMKHSIQKYEKENEHFKINNEHLDKKLNIFRNVMIQCFSDLPLPNTNEYPNEVNIDDYIFRLYAMLNSNALRQQQHQQYHLQHHGHLHQPQQMQPDQQAVVEGTHAFVSNVKSMLSKFDFNTYIDC
jgi:hypothetical protein